jgi:Fungal cellulose binding domain
MYSKVNLADCGQLWPKPTAANWGCAYVRALSAQANKSNMTAVFAVLAALLLALAPTVSATCAHRYERCGGIGYTGPVCCDGHSSCQVQNPYYSQCVPISVPSGSVPWYGQCGGRGYTGSTICEPDSTCVSSGPYYSQCIPN